MYDPSAHDDESSKITEQYGSFSSDGNATNEDIKNLYSSIAKRNEDPNFWKAFQCELQGVLRKEGVETVLESLIDVPHTSKRQAFSTRSGLNRSFLLSLDRLRIRSSYTDEVSRTDQSQMILLHHVCMNDPPVDIVKSLIDVSPNTAFITNKAGMLPIHIACKHQASTEVIQVLCKIYPSSCIVKDLFGRVPLHYIFDPSISFSLDYMRPLMPNPSIVKICADPHITNEADTNGKTPLRLFVQLCNSIQCEIGSEKASEILRLLLDFKQPRTTQFLIHLINLPKWALRKAVTHIHVKDIINEMSAQPLFLASILADIIVQIVLICGYFHFTQKNIDYDKIHGRDESLAIIILFYTALLYRGTCDGIQFIGMIHLRLFSPWARDLWNWFGLINFILISWSSAVMISRSTDLINTGNQQLVMIAGGLQWFVLLIALRSASLGFSVFLRGFKHILFKLIPFLIMSVLLLGAFTFMFHLSEKYESRLSPGACQQVYDEEGVWNHLEDQPYCTFSGTLLLSLQRFIDAGVEEDYLDVGKTQMILVLLFSLIISVLFFNILIAVVTDAYAEITCIGTEVFWRDRLTHILYLQTGKMVFSSCKDGSQSSHHASDKWRILWDDMLSEIYFPMYDDSASVKVYRSLKKTMMLMVLSFWILFGVISFGILLPPQLREWLICIKHIGDGTENSEFMKVMELQETFEHELKALKESSKRNMDDSRDLRDFLKKESVRHAEESYELKHMITELISLQKESVNR